MLSGQISFLASALPLSESDVVFVLDGGPRDNALQTCTITYRGLRQLWKYGYDEWQCRCPLVCVCKVSGFGGDVSRINTSEASVKTQPVEKQAARRKVS